MLPRTVLFALLTTSLLAEPYFELPLPVIVGSVSAETHDSSSLVSPQNSNDDKYSLRGSVVNSLTGEPLRGVLVQVYLNGQSSMLTGPDGRFQFDNLPAGQSTITVRKPGFFAEDDFQPSERGQSLAATGPNSSPVVLKLIPEGVIYGHIIDDDGEPIEGLPVELLVKRQKGMGTTDRSGNRRRGKLPHGRIAAR